MADEFSGFKVSGLRELSDALGELTKATERNVLRRVATRALEPLVVRAKELVPVDEGHLRDSIVIGTQLTRRARSEDQRDPKRGVRVFAGSANRNAVPREFGSTRSPAEPYLRPAWDALQSQMLDLIITDLSADIEATAARVAKRKANRA